MAQTLLNIAADFDTQLTDPVAIGDITTTIATVTDDDGNTLPNGVYGFTVDASNASKEYIIATVTSTALSNVTSINRQGNTTAGFVRPHRRGAKITITDWAILSRMLKNLDGTTGFNSSVKLGYDADPSINSTDLNKFATVKFVNDTAISGAPDATTVTKGITRLSTAPVSATAPIAVGDNDTRVPTQAENDALQGTVGSPSDTNRYITGDDAVEAATASRIPRRRSTGDITVPTTPTNTTDATSKTYVDTAITAATGNPVFNQQIGFNINGVSSVATAFNMATAEADGSVFYTVVAITTSCFIERWQKDSTGAYYRTHDVQHSNPGGVNYTNSTARFGLAIVGSHLYLSYSHSSTTTLVRRFNKADLTSDTAITISGTAPDGSVAYKQMYTNGTDLIICSSTTTWFRYTISGTTITNAATVTSLSGADVLGCVADASNVFFTNSSDVISKYSFTGTLSSSITRPLGNMFGSGETYGLSFASASTFYYLRGGRVESNTAPVARVAYLIPFAKF